MRALDDPITNYSFARVAPTVAPEEALQLSIALAASTHFPAGAILGQNTTTKAFGPYASGNSDGTQVPACILERECWTDANGSIYYNSAGASSQYGESFLTTAAFFSGTFYTGDLPQSGAGSIDANAVSKLGRLLMGTTASGLLMVNGS